MLAKNNNTAALARRPYVTYLVRGTLVGRLPPVASGGPLLLFPCLCYSPAVLPPRIAFPVPYRLPAAPGRPSPCRCTGPWWCRWWRLACRCWACGAPRPRLALPACLPACVSSCLPSWLLQRGDRGLGCGVLDRRSWRVPTAAVALIVLLPRASRSAFLLCRSPRAAAPARAEPP